MQLLGLLAHVDDVVLAKHLWRVGLVSTRAAQGLAWNIHPFDAVVFQKDPDKTLFTSEEDWQKGKWLKVCDSAVHSIFILRLVAKSMPVFLIARNFFSLFWPCCMGNEDAKQFQTSAYELQKSNQSLKEWWSLGKLFCRSTSQTFFLNLPKWLE